MNRFDIKIRAIDDFTKTFRDLNDKASKAARPLVSVQRQIGSLAREIHLDKAAKGIGKLSEATVTLSRTLGLSLGPMESVLGAGGIAGGLLAASGAAVALGVRVANTGFEVSRTSRAIGVSTKDLQLWRGAMQLAGIDADVATQTLASMGRTLQDVRMFRDMDARRVLEHLGVGVPLKNGVVDQVAALDGISRALSRIADPQVRMTLANALHIPPEALPALIEGAEHLEQLRQKAHELGVDLDENAIKKSNEFALSLSVLKVAIDGAGNSMGSRLLPPLAQAVDYMTRMVDRSGKAWKSGSWSNAVGTGLEGANDFRLFPWRAVKWLGSTALHGNMPTTADERRVSGQIGGPLQQGPYAKAAAAAASVASAPIRAGRRGANELSAAENAALDDFTPAERQRQQESEDSAENRRELMRELQKTRNPAARGILEAELTKMDQRVHVEVTFKGAPPGTTATARVASGGSGQVSTRVQYAMPTGDMP